jgi:hypothetical protein
MKTLYQVKNFMSSSTNKNLRGLWVKYGFSFDVAL